MGIAREMIGVAVDAGADAVKFQTYTGSRIYSTNTPLFEYLKDISDKPPAELLEEISLPRHRAAQPGPRRGAPANRLWVHPSEYSTSSRSFTGIRRGNLIASCSPR